jgi:hypothetical protein
MPTALCEWENFPDAGIFKERLSRIYPLQMIHLSFPPWWPAICFFKGITEEIGKRFFQGWKYENSCSHLHVDNSSPGIVGAPKGPGKSGFEQRRIGFAA